VDQDGKLCGAVPLARLFIAMDGQKLKELAVETLIQVNVDEKRDRITELFDKYNLLTLPVTDEDDRLAGVITADDIISLLRHR
jgi:Mg/Co/Ni transporter MgtE